jgi:hypothetical protein
MTVASNNLTDPNDYLVTLSCTCPASASETLLTSDTSDPLARLAGSRDCRTANAVMNGKQKILSCGALGPLCPFVAFGLLD